MDDDRVERLLGRLRAEGARLTVPRRLLVEALVSADGHITANELADRIHRSDPGVNESTVYRNLDALERLGLVEHVHLGHGRAVYHLADDLHHHLVCEGCGAVVEVPARIFAGVARTLKGRHGFTMRPYHFAVLGRCRECVADMP
jgi:Fur family transcriptional regulator, ferric uptake regulator